MSRSIILPLANHHLEQKLLVIINKKYKLKICMNVEDYRGERIAINYDIKDYTFEILRVVVICIYHDVIPKIHIIV